MEKHCEYCLIAGIPVWQCSYQDGLSGGVSQQRLTEVEQSLFELGKQMGRKEAVREIRNGLMAMLEPALELGFWGRDVECMGCPELKLWSHPDYPTEHRCYAGARYGPDAGEGEWPRWALQNICLFAAQGEAGKVEENFLGR